MESWMGASWADLAFVVLGGVAMYVTTIVGVRLAGRRTIAQLSAFDLVITVALGSLVANTIASDDPSYAQGATALVTLLALQVAIGWSGRRIPALRRLLVFEPEVIVRDGTTRLPTGITTSQLTEEELDSRLRQQGVFDRSDLALVVLEPTGDLSIRRSGDLPGEAWR
jgi:uncharacterized membrane protein YcaP (DUF421 family)